jgi:hypothetical protein
MPYDSRRKPRLVEGEHNPLPDTLLIVETLLFCHLKAGDGLLRVGQVLERLPCAGPADFALLETTSDPRSQLLANWPFGTISFDVRTVVVVVLDDGMKRHPCRSPTHREQRLPIDRMLLAIPNALHLEIPPME